MRFEVRWILLLWRPCAIPEKNVLTSFMVYMAQVKICSKKCKNSKNFINHSFSVIYSIRFLPETYSQMSLYQKIDSFVFCIFFNEKKRMVFLVVKPNYVQSMGAIFFLNYASQSWLIFLSFPFFCYDNYLLQTCLFLACSVRLFHSFSSGFVSFFFKYVSYEPNNAQFR